MIVAFDVQDFTRSLFSEPAIVTVGNFDGLHLGHQKIFEHMSAITQKNDRLKKVLVSFRPHPSTVVGKNSKTPLLILSREEKISLLKNQYHFDAYVEIFFSEQFSELSAHSFIKNVLSSYLNAKHVVVGYDFKFGHKKEGDASLLNESRLFETHLVDAIYFEKKPISSSWIRELLLQGNLDLASKLLGKYFEIEGEIVRGDQKGRTFGFPTANLKPTYETNLIPQNGIYAGFVRSFKEKTLKPAAISIGVRPTINSLGITSIEAYILQKDIPLDSLYSQKMGFIFLNKIRGEKKFSSLQELTEAMAQDVEKAKLYIKDLDKQLPRASFMPVFY